MLAVWPSSSPFSPDRRRLELCAILPLALLRPGTRGLITELAEVLLVDAGLDTPTAAPIVRTALRVVREARGQAEPRGAPFGTDASKLARGGVPSIVLGPGSIEQAHSANEWVPIEELAQAAGLYAGIALAHAAARA